MKSRCVFLILLLAVFVAQGSIAQAEGEGEVINFRKTVSIGASIGTVVPREDESTSALGIDYMYRLNPEWEVGIQFDFIYGEGFNEFEAFAVVPVAAYSVTNRFNAFVGAGIEHDKSSDENEFLARLGGEYSIYIDKEQRFVFLPGGFIDFVGGETVVSLLFALGYLH